MREQKGLSLRMNIGNLLKVGFIIINTAVQVNAQAEVETLSADKIIELIPSKISGFYSSSDPISKVMKLGTLHYTVAEKTFRANKKRSVKILLFDYKEAPIMYNQATRKFQTFTPLESDSVILRSVVMTDCTGWESYNVYQKNSQILLGICNRFFLTIEGAGVDLETLKKVVRQFKFETFPK